jgi:hypothetical protein
MWDPRLSVSFFQVVLAPVGTQQTRDRLPTVLSLRGEQCDFVRSGKKGAMPAAGYAYAKNQI